MLKLMKYIFKLSFIPILIASPTNLPSKAELANNSDSKVTVIELKNNDNFGTLNTFRINPPKITKKTPPRFNTSSYSGSRKQPGNIEQINLVSPTNFGTYGFPHTTSLVKSKTQPLITNSTHAITSSKPYSGIGKVIAFSGNTGLLCSGALIGKGVVSTSAHCISDYGDKFYGGRVTDRVIFIPAATSNSSSKNYGGPIGVWEAAKLYIPKCWTKGKCPDSGNVPNENDIAIFTLRKKGSKTPAQRGAYYFNYGWNHPGFTNSSDPFGKITVNKRAHITTLGYPAHLGDKANNRGGSMIRTDSLTFINTEKSSSGVGKRFEQYYWGSGQSGGSSGSPLIINFGFKPNYDTRYKNPGKYSNENVVVGNISWSYGDHRIHVQGASPFARNSTYEGKKHKDKAGKDWGAGNIGYLMRKACGKGYDGGQAKGLCR